MTRGAAPARPRGAAGEVRAGWHNRLMTASLSPLLPLYLREQRAGRTLVLGVLVHTQGSTYQKPGALMLFAEDGTYAGLFSGGCLEADLREHASAVRCSGAARTVRYDLSDPDDLIWGLGLGCEGVMQILLLPVGAHDAWQPLAHLARAQQTRRTTRVALVSESTVAALPAGSLLLPAGPAAAPPHATPEDLLREVPARTSPVTLRRRSGAGEFSVFVFDVAPPPRILLLGAGPDAVPVVEFAARLGWEVTLADHRIAYAVPSRFPAATTVLVPTDAVAQTLPLEEFAAAIVMSHHLGADLDYLRTLAHTHIPYVGLLGPRARRDRLLAELGPAAGRLRGRLHAPVGLPLGGRSPESIALSIIAELHGFIQARLAAPAPTPRLPQPG